jgi:hypothetical protein
MIKRLPLLVMGLFLASCTRTEAMLPAQTSPPALTSTAMPSPNMTSAPSFEIAPYPPISYSTPIEYPPPTHFAPAPYPVPTDWPATSGASPTPNNEIPSFTLSDSIKTLDYYPLELGHTWVYSATYYGYRIEKDQPITNTLIITSTFVYTDKVLFTEVLGPYFIAQLERVSEHTGGLAPDQYIKDANGYMTDWISSSKDFGEYSLDWGIINPSARNYWLIIYGGLIYFQDELDISKLVAPVYYYFPFEKGSCWFTDGLLRNCQQDLENIVWTDFYFIESGPFFLDTQMGQFAGCYKIGYFARGGGNNKYFCLGTGLVGFEWEAHWQFSFVHPPIGHRVKLIDYFISAR